jgi:predicted ATPase
MLGFQLTAKNYRCFADSDPLRLDLGNDFTALVGPNNSGKSTALRLFHELRPLFSYVQHPNQLQNLGAGGTIGLSYQGTEDALEIFCTANDRPLELQFDLSNTRDTDVSRIVLSTRRTEPTTWRGAVFTGPRHEAISSIATVAGTYGFLNASRTEVPSPIDFLKLLGVLADQGVYIGAFRNAISEGSGSYFDMAIGTSFIAKWHSWKTGGSRASNQAILALTNDLAHIFGYRSLEINAALDGQTLQIVIDGKPYRLREVGAGFAQFLVVLANVVIRKPSFLFIDEPELNLHPSLQADFLTTLASHCPLGVMFATHSIGLARSSAERIYGFRREGGVSKVRRFEQMQNLAEFVGEMSYSSFADLGHDRLLLVEGVTEIKAVQQFLRLLGKDHTTVLLPLGGSAMIRAGVQAELAELKRISRNVSVLIDSERTSANAGLPNDRAAFLRDCKALGFRAQALDRRAFENYLTDEAVKAVKGPNYRALQPFELLADITPSWGKSENWRIARAMALADFASTDLGAFLQAL